MEGVCRLGPEAEYTTAILESPSVAGSNSMSRARRPVLCVAINVVPEPAKGSSTVPPRLEQSLMASATSATGLTLVDFTFDRR
jgi:hypothetical protein